MTTPVATLPPEFVAQLAAADVRIPVVAGHVHAALRDLRVLSDEVDLGRHRPSVVMGALPFQEFSRRLDHHLTPAFKRSVFRGAQASGPTAIDRIGRIIRFKQDLGFGFDFEQANQHAVRFATAQSAALVRMVNDETRRALRRIVARGVSGRADPREVERAIKRVIGLNERQAIALERLRENMIESGMSPLKVNAQISRARDRMLRFRAMMIARTETMRSVNMGQQALWLAARDAGLIAGQVVLRRWIVTPDDRLCPFCRPMDGQLVGLEERFRSGQVPRVDGSGFRSFPDVLTPPLHPLCRCTMSLEFQEDVPVLVETPTVPSEDFRENIARWEAQHIGNDFESAAVWKDGDLVLVKKGNADSVEFDDDERQRLLGADVFTHNHPNGTSLSLPDIMFQMTHGIREMRAVGETVDGQRYAYIWRLPDTWPQADRLDVQMAQTDDEVRRFRRVWDRINEEVFAFGNLRFKAGEFGPTSGVLPSGRETGITPDETANRAQAWHSHERNQRVVEIFARQWPGMEYERVPI